MTSNELVSKRSLGIDKALVPINSFGTNNGTGR